MIKDKQLKPGQRYNFLQTAYKNIERLNRLVAELLELSRLDANQVKPQPENFSIAELAQDVIQKFKPQAENPQEFYAELPISIRVIGTYHEFGDFVSGVAALPRIVTLHNISIKNTSKTDEPYLVMDMTAKTYRYLEESERPQESSKKGGGRK